MCDLAHTFNLLVGVHLNLSCKRKHHKRQVRNNHMRNRKKRITSDPAPNSQKTCEPSPGTLATKINQKDAIYHVQDRENTNDHGKQRRQLARKSASCHHSANIPRLSNDAFEDAKNGPPLRAVGKTGIKERNIESSALHAPKSLPHSKCNLRNYRLGKEIPTHKNSLCSKNGQLVL